MPTPWHRRCKVAEIQEALQHLTDVQIELIGDIIRQFRMPYITIHRLRESDIVNDCLLQGFGDALRFHHTISREPFRKDRFEFVLERVANSCGIQAKKAATGNPGYDIT